MLHRKRKCEEEYDSRSKVIKFNDELKYASSLLSTFHLEKTASLCITDTLKKAELRQSFFHGSLLFSNEKSVQQALVTLKFQNFLSDISNHDKQEFIYLHRKLFKWINESENLNTLSHKQISGANFLENTEKGTGPKDIEEITPNELMNSCYSILLLILNSIKVDNDFCKEVAENFSCTKIFDISITEAEGITCTLQESVYKHLYFKEISVNILNEYARCIENKYSLFFSGDKNFKLELTKFLALSLNCKNLQISSESTCKGMTCMKFTSKNEILSLVKGIPMYSFVIMHFIKKILLRRNTNLTKINDEFSFDSSLKIMLPFGDIYDRREIELYQEDHFSTANVNNSDQHNFPVVNSFNKEYKVTKSELKCNLLWENEWFKYISYCKFLLFETQYTFQKKSISHFNEHIPTELKSLNKMHHIVPKSIESEEVPKNQVLKKNEEPNNCEKHRVDLKSKTDICMAGKEISMRMKSIMSTTPVFLDEMYDFIDFVEPGVENKIQKQDVSMFNPNENANLFLELKKSVIHEGCFSSTRKMHLERDSSNSFPSISLHFDNRYGDLNVENRDLCQEDVSRVLNLNTYPLSKNNIDGQEIYENHDTENITSTEKEPVNHCHDTIPPYLHTSIHESASIVEDAVLEETEKYNVSSQTNFEHAESYRENGTENNGDSEENPLCQETGNNFSHSTDLGVDRQQVINGKIEIGCQTEKQEDFYEEFCNLNALVSTNKPISLTPENAFNEMSQLAISSNTGSEGMGETERVYTDCEYMTRINVRKRSRLFEEQNTGITDENDSEWQSCSRVSEVSSGKDDMDEPMDAEELSLYAVENRHRMMKREICGKSKVRVGLSRRQPVKPLHPYWQFTDLE